MEITHAGVTYRFRPGETNHKLDMEFARVTGGLTLVEIQQMGNRGGFAPFMVAAFIFYARRQAGDEITFDEVAEPVTWESLGQDFAIRQIEAVEDTAPEALAAD